MLVVAGSEYFMHQNLIVCTCAVRFVAQDLARGGSKLG